MGCEAAVLKDLVPQVLMEEWIAVESLESHGLECWWRLTILTDSSLETVKWLIYKSFDLPWEP